MIVLERKTVKNQHWNGEIDVDISELRDVVKNLNDLGVPLTFEELLVVVEKKLLGVELESRKEVHNKFTILVYPQGNTD